MTPSDRPASAGIDAAMTAANRTSRLSPAAHVRPSDDYKYRRLLEQPRTAPTDAVIGDSTSVAARTDDGQRAGCRQRIVE